MPSYPPVYSVPFVIYTPDTPNTSFAVPEGYTAIVRDMDVYQNVGDYIAYLGLGLSEVAPIAYCVGVASSGFGNYAQWRGRIVVPGGGFVYFALSEIGSSVAGYVGGYLLRNTLT